MTEREISIVRLKTRINTREETWQKRRNDIGLNRGRKTQASLFPSRHHAMKIPRRRTEKAPRILDLGSGWKWVVSFALQPITPGELAAGTRYT
jgi:hypothetical protein